MNNSIKTLIKKKLLVIVFASLASAAFADESSVTWSAGSIGGGATFGASERESLFIGSLFDVYLVNGPSKIGIKLSPFGFTAQSNDEFRISIVNVEVFYRAVGFGDHSFLGPFASLKWLNFRDNEEVFSAGVKLLFRNEVDFRYIKGFTGYHDPFLFKYLEFDAGMRLYKGEASAYLSASIDASLLVPVLLVIFKDQTYLNAQKVSGGK